MRLPLTPLQFRDALEKGLGRAILHARKHGLEGMHGELQRAVVNCLVYDPQCEWHRPAWLWKLIRAGRSEGRYRSTVLRELSKVKEYRDAQQLCELASRYARSGDAGAKRALYSIFERFVGVDNHGIEREIMLVDGAKGLRKIGDRVGRQLIKGGDEWKLRVESIWWNAKDILGAAAARRALKGGGNAGLFLDRALMIEVSNKKERRARLARLKTEGPKRKTWAEFLYDIENPGMRSASPFVFARSATNEELRSAFAALSIERRPLQASKLLHVFVRRSPPTWKPFLLKFARSSDDRVQSFAWDVLAHFRRPEVRRAALAAARRRRDVANGALSLFGKNYRRGDADLILSALTGGWKKSEDPHCVVMSVDDIAKGSADKALAPVYIAAYGLTPCALCRRDQFKTLLRLKAAPEWMKAECVEDADEDSRALAKEAAK